MILAGAAIGLLASTLGRLYASVYYALRYTHTLFRCGADCHEYWAWLPERNSLAASVGARCALGVVGLTVASSLAGWVELALLTPPQPPHRFYGTGIIICFQTWRRRGIRCCCSLGCEVGRRTAASRSHRRACPWPIQPYIFRPHLWLGVREARVIAGRLLPSCGDFSGGTR